MLAWGTRQKKLYEKQIQAAKDLAKTTGDSKN